MHVYINDIKISLTLLRRVTRKAGGNTDLPSNSNILKKISVTFLLAEFF